METSCHENGPGDWEDRGKGILGWLLTEQNWDMSQLSSKQYPGWEVAAERPLAVLYDDP